MVPTVAPEGHVHGAQSGEGANGVVETAGREVGGKEGE